MPKRLAVSTFEFPLAEIRHGYRSAVYFNRTKEILIDSNKKTSAMMQVFQKNSSVLCGMDEVIALLKQCTGFWSDKARADEVFSWYMKSKIEARKKPLDIEMATAVIKLEQELEDLWVNTWNQLLVEALYDGDWISPWESVLQISGEYRYFAHLESVYLGILARSTKVATNVYNIVRAAKGKEVLFFADRFDRWSNQGSDGYAAHIGGAYGVASDAMADWWGSDAIGTMPHALIAMFDGDTASAAMEFNKHYPDVNLVALVDFNNDCIKDTLKCAEVLGDKLWGVRLDTSENLMDPCVSASEFYGKYKPTGVNPMLVWELHKALDEAGHKHVKIVVSGGFNAEKVSMFEEMCLPVHAYAVGSSFFQGSNDFTADIVLPSSKVGRRYASNPRLTVAE